MNKETFKKDLEQLTPSSLQKKKMLNHILYKTTSRQAKTEKTVVKMHKQVNYFLSMAACFIGLLLGGKLVSYYFSNQNPPMGQQGVLPDATEQIHQYIFYNGRTYVQTQIIDSMEFEFVAEIGRIEDLVYTEADIKNQELSATIGLGGTVWEIAQCSSEDKIVLEYSGAYYLFENIKLFDSREEGE